MNVFLPESERAIILAASIKIQCKTCHAIWGVYINLADGIPPEGWDTCHNCEKKSYYSNKKEMVNYEKSVSK